MNTIALSCAGIGIEPQTAGEVKTVNDDEHHLLNCIQVIILIVDGYQMAIIGC